MIWIVLVLVVPVATVAVSYLVEALRRAPPAPSHFNWAPDLPIRSVEVDGVRLRYVVAGSGPQIVLLHTLRTQLDIFQKVVPALTGRFRVYALDYPGHGWSDIPSASYSAEYFATTVAKALGRLGVEQAVVMGESIGGSIALLLAARRHPSVRAVVAINPYDYDAGRGVRRSSPLANLVFGLNDVPVLGATVSRLRSFPIARRILEGGVRRSGALPKALVREMYLVGNRRGHYRALMSLIAQGRTWEVAREEYRAIDRPVLLIYGDHDWSREEERRADAALIPGAELGLVPNAGHFLSLDAPDELLAAVVPWVTALPRSSDIPGALLDAPAVRPAEDS